MFRVKGNKKKKASKKMYSSLTLLSLKTIIGLLYLWKIDACNLLASKIKHSHKQMQ